MTHCTICGFTYEEHSAEEIPRELRECARQFGPLLQASGAGPAILLRTRPHPEVWSSLEYACHARDVLLAQRERFYQALVEECPNFTPLYREQRLVTARYEHEDPARVGLEVGIAGEQVAWAFEGASAATWRRTCIYNFPEPSERTLLWFAQHTLHETHHHLLDLTHVQRQLLG